MKPASDNLINLFLGSQSTPSDSQVNRFKLNKESDPATSSPPESNSATLSDHQDSFGNNAIRSATAAVVASAMIANTEVKVNGNVNGNTNGTTSGTSPQSPSQATESSQQSVRNQETRSEANGQNGFEWVRQVS